MRKTARFIHPDAEKNPAIRFPEFDPSPRYAAPKLANNYKRNFSALYNSKK
jgi:hypothetical protein